MSRGRAGRRRGAPGGGRRGWLVGLLAAAILVAAAGVGLVAGSRSLQRGEEASRRAASEPPALVPREGSGRPLPSFTLRAFGGEGVISSEDLAGKPLVLNFWASWCPFCVDEMPGFEEVHQELGGAVVFLGVDLQDDPKLARDLVGRTGVTYLLAEDPDGSLFARIGGLGMPTTLLVSADGRIEEHVTGPLTAEQLRDLILDRLFEAT